MPQTVEDNGVTHEFPDDATPDEMNAALAAHSPTVKSAPEEVSLYDVAQQINRAFSPSALAGMNAGQEQMNRDLSPQNDRTISEALQSPLVPIVKHLPQDKSVGSTLLRKAGSVAEFVESPAGLATAGVATAGKLGAQLVGATFAAQGLKDLPESASKLINAKSPGETAGAAFDVGMDALMGLGGVHAALGREHISPAAVEQPTVGTEQVPNAVEGKAPAEAAPAPAEKGPFTLSPETKAALAEHGAAIKDVVKDIREVQSVTDLDRATMQWNRKRQQSFQQADALEQAIRQDAPTQARQEAISVWREAAGDATVLKDWETQAKGKKFREAAKAAQTLTPEEQGIAGLADKEFYEAGTKGQAADVLGDLRDAYVPHQWELGNYKSGSGGRGLATSARFQKARTFNTFFEGDQAGFKPKEMAIGKLLPSYVHELNSIIANREFIRDISRGKSKAGLPLVTPTGRVSAAESPAKSVLVKPDTVQWVTDPKTGELTAPNGYKVMADQPALKKWQWKHSLEDGTPVLMNADLALHPEAHARVNAMVGESILRKWAKSDATSGAGKLARSAVLVGDAVSAEIKKSMFGIGAPFHQVQEGTHAIGHGIAPWGHEPIDLQGNAAQIDAVENGGLMLLPERFSGAGYEEGIGGSDALIMKGIAKLGKAGRAVQKVSEQYQRYLFHDYIPRLKYATYKAALARNLSRFEKEIASGKMTEGDVKMLTGHQVNAAYGHLNYALLDRNPTRHHIERLVALAPDFLEARGRFVAQALKTFTGSKAGREQLNAILKLAAFQAALAFTATKLGGGEYDPKHPFEAIIGNRRYTMRSVPEDLMRAVPFLGKEGDARAFWTARASVPLSTMVQIMSGVNYRREKSTPEEALSDALGNTIPLIIRQVPGVSNLRHLISPTSKNDPVSPLEQLAGSLGLKISRSSPVHHAYEMVEKWKDENKIAKDKGTYPISKYQQLRYALEDNSDNAIKEYDKLVATDGRAKVRTGFVQSLSKPWTGSAANDAKFRKSLSEDDKQLLKLADDRRHEIVRRFHSLH